MNKPPKATLLPVPFSAIQKATTMIRVPLGQFDLGRIESNDGEVTHQVAQAIGSLTVDANAFLPGSWDCRFEPNRITMSVLDVDFDAAEFLFEMDEFQVTSPPWGTPEGEVSQGLQEVGLPLTIPSQ